MVDMLKLGSTSLLSLQQAMTTTGHNIANVNTEGYSRQTVQFTTNNPQRFTYGYIGQGASISDVKRSYNEFLTNQLQEFTSSQSKHQTFVDLSARIDDILGNSNSSLNSSIQKFFSAAQDVASNPSTLPERQVLIGEANNMVDRHNNFANLLNDLNKEVNMGLSALVNDVNALADNISLLNKEIVSASSAGSSTSPNDLLDQRDRYIRQLAEKISVNSISQADGSLSVFVGKGTALVVGNVTTHLVTQTNPYDSSHLEVSVAGQSNINGNSNEFKGGAIEGILDFRDKVLKPAQQELGLVVLGLSETTNAQHKVGLDLNGNNGLDFFSTLNINAASHSSNTGTTVPAVTITDVSNVRASDYLVSYDGTQWKMTRLSDNTSVTGTGPLAFDGMNVDVSGGTPVTGDSFLLNPAKEASNSFSVTITDPRKIAAASSLIADNKVNNLGDGGVSDITVAPTNTLPLANANSNKITLTFNADALGTGIPGFDVLGVTAGPLAYDPATESGGKSFTISSLGISFKVAKVPQNGDSFDINNNINGTGDNSNIVKIGELQQKSTINGGQDSFQEFYGSMVAKVGVSNRQASANLEVETTLLNQAVEYRDNASGVSLDEEAANLIRYQQSYQAAAKLIQIADEIFQTLINSLR